MSRPQTAPRWRVLVVAPTATSSFGVSRREGHDASVYYTSRLNEGLVSSRDVGAAQAFPEEHANTVLCGDSRTLPLPDNCVHLVVTSPPYNASKEYDENLSLKEYLTLLHDVFGAECYRCWRREGVWWSTWPIWVVSPTFRFHLTSTSS